MGNQDKNHLFHSLHLAFQEVGVGIVDGRLETLDADFLKGTLSALPNAIVFDVGAHTGLFSRKVFEYAPTSKVFAFEPNQSSFDALTKTHAPEGGAFNCFNLAISDHQGQGTLYFESDSSCSPLSSLYQGVIGDLHKQESHGQEVTIRTLDSVVEELNLPGINLLKLDMEGAEYAALKGAENLLKEKRIHIIHFEFNDMNVISRIFFKDFWDLLSPSYNVYRLSPHGMIHLVDYSPMFCENFAIQTIVCMIK